VSPLLSLNTSAASTRHISSPEDRITSIKHCAPRISSKMATIDEFVLKILVFDEGTESADIATNENILLLDDYSKVKLF
jgi:hypothetical protein